MLRLCRDALTDSKPGGERRLRRSAGRTGLLQRCSGHQQGGGVPTDRLWKGAAAGITGSSGGEAPHPDGRHRTGSSAWGRWEGLCWGIPRD